MVWHLELPCLCHNQMMGYFEALCGILGGPALDFLHICKNLLPLTKDFHGEEELAEHIVNFSRDALRWE